MAKSKVQTYPFRGMTNVKGSLEGPIVNSVSAFNKMLKTYRIVSASGDYGAVNVCKDDDGQYLCEFHQYQMVINSQTFERKFEALDWVRQWFPRCKEQS